MTPMSDAWPSYTARIDTPEAGHVYVRLAYDGDYPRHLYAWCGKAGTEAAGMADALSRVGSKLLRHEGVESLVRSLRGVSHGRSGGRESESVSDGIGRAIEAIETRRRADQRAA